MFDLGVSNSAASADTKNLFIARLRSMERRVIPKGSKLFVRQRVLQLSDDVIDATGSAITAVAPDQLTAKALSSWSGMAVLAVLAGMFIAFGSIAFLIAQAVPGGHSSGGQLLSGFVFSVGLILTMVAGAELFTGNTLFVLPLVLGKLGAGRMVAAWVVVWLGNLVGSVIVAVLFVAAGGGWTGPPVRPQRWFPMPRYHWLWRGERQ